MEQQSPFTTPRGSLSSSIGDANELEAMANLSLSDRLKVFKSSTFDPNAYVASKSRSMNEKVPPSLSLFILMLDEHLLMIDHIIFIPCNCNESKNDIFVLWL